MCGPGRTRSSSPSSVPRAPWTSPGRLSTAPPSGRLKGEPKTGRSPVDRVRTGSRHHLITDATGMPLTAALTGGNRNDVTQPIPLLQGVPPVRGTRGRPRRPDVVLGDRGYDHGTYPPAGPGPRREAADRPPRHRTPAPAWAPNAGSRSAHSPTCTGSTACGSAGRSATTATKPSSSSDAHSSAGGDRALWRTMPWASQPPPAG